MEKITWEIFRIRDSKTSRGRRTKNGKLSTNARKSRTTEKGLSVTEEKRKFIPSAQKVRMFSIYRESTTTSAEFWRICARSVTEKVHEVYFPFYYMINFIHRTGSQFNRNDTVIRLKWKYNMPFKNSKQSLDSNIRKRYSIVEIFHFIICIPRISNE